MIKISCSEKHWNRISWNKHLMKENADNFFRTFNMSLAAFWHLEFGFRMTEFKMRLKPNENESIKDAVSRKFGLVSVEMVTRVIEPMPIPDYVVTWVDLEFDPLNVEVGKFKKCEFSFILADEFEMTGKGYIKDGLVVHRDIRKYEPYNQDPGGHWIISTLQGIQINQGYETKSFDDAKRQASAFALALDFTKAQTSNLTDEQYKAACRVFDILYPGGK